MFYTYQHNDPFEDYSDRYSYSPFGRTRGYSYSGQTEAAKEAARLRYLQNKARLQREREERELYNHLLWREEEDRRRKHALKQQRRRPRFTLADTYQDDDEPRIVRGRDGRLYWVQTPTPFSEYVTEDYQERKDEPMPTTNNSSEENQNVEESPRACISEIDDAPTRKSPPTARVSHFRRSVVVEDASDSEDEDDEYRSPWRNRRPSPGEWMEPVESL